MRVPAFVRRGAGPSGGQLRRHRDGLSAHEHADRPGAPTLSVHPAIFACLPTTGLTSVFAPVLAHYCFPLGVFVQSVLVQINTIHKFKITSAKGSKPPSPLRQPHVWYLSPILTQAFAHTHTSLSSWFTSQPQHGGSHRWYPGPGVWNDARGVFISSAPRCVDAASDLE